MEPHKARITEHYNPSGLHVVRNELEKEFDSVEYLKFTKAENFQDIRKFFQYKLQCLHESFSTIPDGVRVLDYGAGPHLASIISAASKASEIVMADFLPQNRAHLNHWLNMDENAFRLVCLFYLCRAGVGGNIKRWLRKENLKFDNS